MNGLQQSFEFDNWNSFVSYLNFRMRDSDACDRLNGIYFRIKCALCSPSVQSLQHPVSFRTGVGEVREIKE